MAMGDAARAGAEVRASGNIDKENRRGERHGPEPTAPWNPILPFTRQMAGTPSLF
jgi:hypothetical protein